MKNFKLNMEVFHVVGRGAKDNENLQCPNEKTN